MRIRSSLWLVALGVFVLATVGFNPAALAQKVTGAIFTTDCIDHDNDVTTPCVSTFVNGNVYDFGEDVYLNGGPRPNAPCTAAGLLDGDYYFQVTDPSGATLLSTDETTNRSVTVSGGLMVAHSGTHGIGIGKCNDGTNHTDNITVQLMPFSLTPNPGGEYKAWMTKVGDYACNPSLPQLQCTIGVYGFVPSKSKTDNFKVLPPPIVGDCPNDSDCDGLTDSDEVNIFGTNPNNPDTDGDGQLDGSDTCPTDPTESCVS